MRLHLYQRNMLTMFPKVPQSSLACFKVLITYELLNIKYSGDVALFEEVGMLFIWMLPQTPIVRLMSITYHPPSLRMSTNV
jgi:hypothetical protein